VGGLGCRQHAAKQQYHSATKARSFCVKFVTLPRYKDGDVASISTAAHRRTKEVVTSGVTHLVCNRSFSRSPTTTTSLFVSTLLPVFFSLFRMSYSSFFFSGLSAIQHLTPPPSPTQPVRPDSPIVPLTPTRVATDVPDQDPTPTAANPCQGLGLERPKLRKRRSSLTANTSPLIQLKGSYRGATAAIQRQNRSRSGSVNAFSQPRSAGFGTEENNIIGRLRSGSVGNSLRCALFFFSPGDTWRINPRYTGLVVLFEEPGHLLLPRCRLCQPPLPRPCTLATSIWERAPLVAVPSCPRHRPWKALNKKS